VALPGLVDGFSASSVRAARLNHIIESPVRRTYVRDRRSADPVLTTQEAADLAGVSRPYIVARIDAGDVALHQQVSNQRRVLQSAVESW
jgi:excisionase family DNA binding protein